MNQQKISLRKYTRFLAESADMDKPEGGFKHKAKKK